MDEEFEVQRDKIGLLIDDRGKKGIKIFIYVLIY